jgi:hypothetical protein
VKAVHVARGFQPSGWVLVCLICVSCGKKGPPLPPLVRLPAPPADFSAQLRGTAVDLQLTIPAANTDNSRPANIHRVDLYAITSRDPLTEPQIVKYGKRVASVDVKAPRNPDDAIEEDEPPADMEAPEGRGLDQGAVARMSESLDGAARVPATVAPVVSARKDRSSAGASAAGPLVPALPVPLTRTYVAVGVSTNDHRGPFSRRIAVPLAPPPPAPAKPTVAYDDKAITVTWTPIASAPQIQPPPAAGELPSTAIGVALPPIRYNVYDTTVKDAPVRLSKTPLSDPSFSDPRVVFGEERCYVVRAVESLGDLAIESDAAPAVCETLRDTFPPSPPANLQSSPQEGAVTLIWDPNTEKDMNGYIVLRGTSAAALEPITSAPIQVTQYRDEHLEAGVRFVYAVKAVDKAGNVSAASNTVEEAAR